ncbi:hypothetical protein A374_06096 [Fictibacillus macauensis ZFHKF-1]|uniref:Uncharacterized protein n=1 Tax=Fictibacillus macauensis ZFHKF-1 TaxID=1196324 RepID=I8AK10_9BACL|nr:hypothetical protein [Fictibacillus macauensis]EIT86147.1 hypothetical protein A374_06096 [Fictibacillus macauensis ZFHKF-1]
MKVWLLLKRDVYLFTATCYKRFSVTVCCLLLLVFFQHTVRPHDSALALVQAVFRGFSRESHYTFPIYWLSFHLASSLIVSNQWRRDLLWGSTTRFMNGYARWEVWCSKLLLIGFSTFLFTSTYFGLILIFTSLIPSVPALSFVDVRVFLLIYSIQLLVTFVLHVLYVVCNLVLPAVFSFLIMIVWLSMTALLNVPYNPFNLSLTNRLVATPALHVIALLALSILLALAGSIIFKNKEIISQKENSE